MKELQRQANPNIVIALAGNKADLANKRMVEYEVRFCLRLLFTFREVLSAKRKMGDSRSNRVLWAFIIK